MPEEVGLGSGLSPCEQESLLPKAISFGHRPFHGPPWRAQDQVPGHDLLLHPARNRGVSGHGDEADSAGNALPFALHPAQKLLHDPQIQLATEMAIFHASVD